MGTAIRATVAFAIGFGSLPLATIPVLPVDALTPPSWPIYEPQMWLLEGTVGMALLALLVTGALTLLASGSHARSVILWSCSVGVLVSAAWEGQAGSLQSIPSGWTEWYVLAQFGLFVAGPLVGVAFTYTVGRLNVAARSRSAG